MEFVLGYGLEALKSSSTIYGMDPNQSNMDNAGCSRLWLLPVFTYADLILRLLLILIVL